MSVDVWSKEVKFWGLVRDIFWVLVAPWFTSLTKSDEETIIVRNIHEIYKGSMW